MTIGNLFIRHFAKPPVLKKISDFFNRPFAITKTEKLYMIANIPLMNQKQSIADLKTQTQNRNLEPIYYKSQNPDFRSQYLISKPIFDKIFLQHVKLDLNHSI